ncbi:hypothetical protein NECAME_13284 [Necator americanus]|uniref:TIL domain-containing protein n=1 Tax=Necator americanus TaxID=51031 RepID=W2SWJ1_NECAM|nr:hypothetical protein NECAME_13284 [Necator americanus]ETN73995.1 hypothetical protein NECAME_13284 [Necator americanus]
MISAIASASVIRDGKDSEYPKTSEETEECSGAPGSGNGSGEGSGENSGESSGESSGEGSGEGSGGSYVDSGDCPPNMILGTCKPICQQDCKLEPACDGIQCGEEETCSCKAGYVLVSTSNPDLGCVRTEECGNI